jgi:hypothetical protein
LIIIFLVGFDSLGRMYVFGCQMRGGMIATTLVVIALAVSVTAYNNGVGETPPMVGHTSESAV